MKVPFFFATKFANFRIFVKIAGLERTNFAKFYHDRTFSSSVVGMENRKPDAKW